jgi:hypothetical protein
VSKSKKMANTRFNYDDCRTMKRNQQATDPGRWILNEPGNGTQPFYVEDPYIRIQKWGGNLRTNVVNLESDLRGVNRHLSRDCIQDVYQKFDVPNASIEYPSTAKLSTSQSRATDPAWWYREKEQVDWYYPPLNPQENTCMPFLNNLNTRILEKDYFVPEPYCLRSQTNDVEVNTNFANITTLR